MDVALRVGIDFDNTIIGYDGVFLSIARDWGLVRSDFVGGKQMVRDAIRSLPNGELSWQRLQSQVYGKCIDLATVFDGVDHFLRRCRRNKVPVIIISHKTKCANVDPDGINLRETARRWMTARGFFSETGYSIAPRNVYFESTRQDKLSRIAKLGCSHFIDDLEEVLTDPAFPDGVERILFAANKPTSDRYVVCPTWQCIEARVFSGNS